MERVCQFVIEQAGERLTGGCLAGGQIPQPLHRGWTIISTPWEGRRLEHAIAAAAAAAVADAAIAAAAATLSAGTERCDGRSARAAAAAESEGLARDEEAAAQVGWAPGKSGEGGKEGRGGEKLARDEEAAAQ
eukprot:351644-Chlamydomonas_euryale.AAC.7